MKLKLILKNEGGFEAGYEPTYTIAEVDIPGITAMEAMSTCVIGGQWQPKEEWIYHINEQGAYPYECPRCGGRFATVINPSTGAFITKCPNCDSAMELNKLTTARWNEPPKG